MSENFDHTTKMRMRRIPRIVFERPGFDRKRFGLFLLVAIVSAFLFGALLWWTAGLGADETGALADDKFPTVYAPSTSWRFLPSFTIIGILAGIGLGWAWKRGITPRIEMIEVQTSTRESKGRRRSTSRSLARVER